MIELKDVIATHGLKRYVFVRQLLNNRFAVTINDALDIWKSHTYTRKYCTPAILIPLGNYYDNKYKKDNML